MIMYINFLKNPLLPVNSHRLGRVLVSRLLQQREQGLCEEHRSECVDLEDVSRDFECDVINGGAGLGHASVVDQELEAIIAHNFVNLSSRNFDCTMWINIGTILIFLL